MGEDTEVVVGEDSEVVVGGSVVVIFSSIGTQAKLVLSGFG